VQFMMWKNTAESGRPPKTIWRMRIACWIHTATETPSEYVIFIAFVRQQWLHQSASPLRYTYIVCLANLPAFWEALLQVQSLNKVPPLPRLLIPSPMV
jgi:hypothetical protein